MAVKLEQEVREQLVSRMQRYLRDELNVEMGNFDVEFLLDFFAREAGIYYYNQGLADARRSLELKVDEFAEVIYALEQQPPG